MQKFRRLLVALSLVAIVAAIAPAAASATPARNSVLLRTTIPSTMVANSTYKVVIQMKNTGTNTWTYPSSYLLKGLGTSDPFTKVLSYRFGKSERIPLHHWTAFTITMRAPSHAGTYVTDWRMYKGNSGFGETVVRRVKVVPVALSSIALTALPTKLHYLTGEQLDLSGMVVTGTYNNGTKSVMPVSVSDVTGFDSHAGAPGQSLTVTVGGKTVRFTVDIVEKKPAISAVHISSNSAQGSSVAAKGDIITLTFTSDEPVSKLGNFKINGSNPDTFTHVGNVYTATHLVDSGDPITLMPATFQINVENVLGIYSQTVEVTNDNSSVTVDAKPFISAVHISSNSAKGSSVAATGDVVTLTFTSNEPVSKLGNFKINGSNPDTFTHVGNVYTATHLVDSGDPITGNPANFQINVKSDASGVYSQTIEVTNDKSSVTIVDEKPAISAVHISSNSAQGSSVAASGDVVTLTFTSDEPVSKLGNFKINGSNPDTFTHVGNVYTATHLVDSGDSITGDPATFQINVKNDAHGIYSQTIEVTNDASSVTIVYPMPVISAVHISSNSAKGSSVAATGDVITLTFTSDVPVSKLGNFKINGSNPDAFVSDGNNVYTATHLVDSGDPITGNPATFQINVKTSAHGVYSQTIEVTNDKSSVTIVDEKPVISSVHISSDSGKGSSVAAIGDIITLVFTSDEPISKLGNFKINSSNPTTFTRIGTSNVYKATHLVDSGDPITGNPATFQINVENVAHGIYSQTIEVTNDKSSVTIVN